MTLSKQLRPREFWHLLGVGRSTYHLYRERGLIPEPTRMGLRAVAHPPEHLAIALQRIEAEFGGCKRPSPSEDRAEAMAAKRRRENAA